MYLSIQIHFFQTISAVIVTAIDNVKKFALTTNAVIERDFKRRFMFRTCSIATKLLTSLEFYSDLFLFSWTVSCRIRISSVLPHSPSDSNAATSSATRENRAIPEWPFRNEEKNSINVTKRCALRPNVHFSMKP